MIPIFLLILLSVGLGEDIETEPPYLQCIADNFAILSRISNAIAIKARVAKGNFSVTDIVSEFLHMPYPIFKSIVDVDIDKLNSVIDFANKSIHDTNRKDNDDTFERKALSLLRKIDVLFKSDPNVLEKAFNVSTENIFNEGRKISSSDIVNNDCLKLNTTNLNEFGKLFDMNNYWHLLPEKEYIKQVISYFTRQNTTLLNCINNVTKLAQFISSSTIWKADEEYKDVDTMRQIAAKFIQFKLDKNSSDKIKNNMYTMLKSDNESIGRYPSLIDAIKIFRQAMNKTLEQFENVQHFPLHYTVAFDHIEDIAKLPEDLKSPWFNEHFVKNGRNEEFGKALDSVVNFSKRIEGVVHTWHILFRVFEHLIRNKKRNVFDDYLAIVEKVHPIRDTLINHLTIWKSKNKTCAQLNYSNETLERFADYERQQYAPLAVIRRISKLRKHVDKMNYQLHFVSQDNRSVLDIFKTHLSFVSNVESSGDDPLINRYTLRDLIDHLGVNAKTFLRTVKFATELAENLQKLKNESESLSLTRNIITLKEVVDKMNLTNFVGCIRNKRMKISLFFEWYRKRLEMEHFFGKEGLNYTAGFVSLLMNISNSIGVFDSSWHQLLSDGKENRQTENPVLNIKDSLVNTLVVGIRVLRDMEKVRSNKNGLQNIGALTRYETNALKEFNLDEWQNMTGLLKALTRDVDDLNSVAKILWNANISNVTQIFLHASNISGIPGTRKNFVHFYEKMYRVSPEVAVKKFQLLYNMSVDFNFAASREDLINVPDKVNQLMNYFDVIFGRKTKAMEEEIPKSKSIWIKIISACLGVFVLIVLGSLVYGLSENGRKKCQNWYLYYFVNWKVFEKRWRYSLFLDAIDMKNALLDAVRERNKANLLKALKSGAYIDVYNKHGNTALHVATKTGLPEFVDILIKYGADRSLLNARNLTPEEVIPTDFNKTQSKDASNFEQIQAIYKKYNKKTFRIAVPQVFPVTSFHIWMDDSTNDNITNAFMEKFPHITSDEAMPTTTHVIFPTDAAGVVQIDRLEQLIWIFHGAIIVKEQWMVDCLKDPKLIEHDSDYLVEKVRFNGVVYDTVLQWTEAMAKGTMPYLCGTYVAAVMKECSYLSALNVIVTNQGGVMMPSFPVKDGFNIGSHPCLHANLGPLFLIYDGTFNLAQYKNDPDKMYTIFTKNEFIAFLLKRQINRDTRKNPPPVSKDNI